MEKKYDLISIGDTQNDVFQEIHDASAVCTINPEECWFCVHYASKIGVDKLTRIVAVGNASNNAIGSSRMGLKTAFYTHVGDDTTGEECLEVFKKENVSTDFVQVDKGKKSNFSSVINFRGERVIFVYHEKRDYSLPDLPPAGWAYFSSAAEGHDVLHAQIPEYIRRTDAKLGFNPGTYQLAEGLEGLSPILEVCEALLVNREEAHKLAGGDISDTKNLLGKLRRYGPKMVVITDARNGSYFYDGERFLHCGIPEKSPVVERTGVGDAYSTGFIAALIKGKGVEEAMIQATLNSTSVLQYIGAREGLLTSEGVEKMREKWGNDFRVEEF